MAKETRVKRPYLCPHCGAELRLYVEVTGLDVRPPREQRGPSSTPPTAPDYTAADEKLLEAARQAGLLEPFERAVKAAQPNSVPKDMELFFVTVMQQSVPRQVARPVLNLFRAEFPGTRLTFLASQSVLTVMADNCIRMFVPYRSTRPTGLGDVGRVSVGQRELQIDDVAQKVEAWIRTKHGYVAGPGTLLDVLRQPYYGSFARPGS